MQKLAAENNQAETAFLLRGTEPGRYGLRWFTPTMEVPLCGHATLASAHVLYAELGFETDSIVFDTPSGQLMVGLADGGYEMDFPAIASQRIEPPEGLELALGVSVDEVWAGPMLVAIVAEEAVVRAAKPDLSALKEIGSTATQGRGNVGISALASGQPYDVVSRFFAPGSGIPEDPATGSFHCMLMPLFAEKLSSDALHFHQAYPGRGGDLECKLRSNRVLLRGGAFTIVESLLRM